MNFKCDSPSEIHDGKCGLPAVAEVRPYDPSLLTFGKWDHEVCAWHLAQTFQRRENDEPFTDNGAKFVEPVFPFTVEFYGFSDGGQVTKRALDIRLIHIDTPFEYDDE